MSASDPALDRPASGRPAPDRPDADAGSVSRAARLADRAVAWYQVRVSPRTRTSCAHRVAHGGESCSQAVRRTLRSSGLLGSAVPTLARFAACYRAVRLLTPHQRVRGVCCCGGIPIPFGFGRR
ncbi:membrane protein insertion efficiency factor YidD [Aquipuribacter sp. SD81]|uniref:membrane protein insertion efficiency factor YidD n=1 Tax=Aquipuribacter sp. SD81 TaxID=3127703 RepID=UPI00301957AB